MKQFFKPILLAVTANAGMMLSGCNSGLDPNTFTVELDVKDTSNWYAQNQSATVYHHPFQQSQIRLMSPTFLINNGECSYEGYRRSLEYPQHFKTGHTFKTEINTAVAITMWCVSMLKPTKALQAIAFNSGLQL